RYQASGHQFAQPSCGIGIVVVVVDGGHLRPLLHDAHRLRLGLDKQRRLPRAFLLHCEPQDRPSNGLRSLPLVVPQRLLVARVLQPLALLAADLGGVLLALHNGVPLCSGPDSVGNSLVDDVLQCHTALTSGLPGTSWHSTHLGSYTSSPSGRMTGLSHGAGSPLISRWVRVASSPQRAHTAASLVTLSAIANRYAMPSKGSPRKLVSSPATMTSWSRDNSTRRRTWNWSQKCASSTASTSAP